MFKMVFAGNCRVYSLEAFVYFLFTRDGPFEGEVQHAALHDNVIFKAGFCKATRRLQRTILILEEGAKISAVSFTCP